MIKDNNQPDGMVRRKTTTIAAIATSMVLLGTMFALLGVNDGISQQASAQQAGQQTGNATTIANVTSVKTFTANGVITGTIQQGAASNQSSSSSNPYLVGGDWQLQVNNGNVTNFRANFTMVRTDASGLHSMDIMNFKVGNNTNFQLEPKGSTSINGTADYAVNGTTKWPGINTTLTIDKATILTIRSNEEPVKQHFGGQPIYGIALTITGENGTKIVTSTPAAGGQAQQGGGGIGGILGNITKPLQNLFGGGKK